MASDSIEEALVTVLKASTTITNYVGTGTSARIYWIQAPANSTTLPYITFTTITRNNDAFEFGTESSQVRIQCSVWNDNKQNGQDLAQNIVELFDQRTTAMDGYTVFWGTVNGPIQFQDPDSDKLFQFIVDLNINFAR